MIHFGHSSTYFGILDYVLPTSAKIEVELEHSSIILVLHIPVTHCSFLLLNWLFSKKIK